MSTQTLSYRVFFFTLYSLGLRLGEGLRLTVAAIDAARRRVHIRAAKGNKDRLVPLPDTTLELLRRFWRVHRPPGAALFPNRHGGASKALLRCLRRWIVVACRSTLGKVVDACGIKL